jgi:hypothetical protein
MKASTNLASVVKDKDLIDQLEVIIAERRAQEYLDLMSNAITEQDKREFKTWYKKVYLPIEAESIDTWIETCQDLVDETVKIDKHNEIINFNEFMCGIWIKYHQVYHIMYAIGNDELAPLILDEQLFSKLPKSSLQNRNEFKLFKDFIEYDIEIEISRAIKLQILTQLAEIEVQYSLDIIRDSREFTQKKEKALKALVSDQIVTFIINTILKSGKNKVNDEDVYNDILNKLNFG